MVTETVMAIIVLAAILGTAHRTLLPYIRKAKEAQDAGKPIKFNTQYLITLGIAIGGAIPATFAIMQAILPQINEQTTQMAAFFMTYAFAYTFNDVANDTVAT